MDFTKLMREEREKARKAKALSTIENSMEGFDLEVKRAQTSIKAESARHPEEVSTQAFPPFELLEKAPIRELRSVKTQGLEGVCYVPDFITEREEMAMLEQTRCPAATWTTLRSRRLQCYGFGDHGHCEMPPWLDKLSEVLVKSDVFPAAFKPNHALINEYLPGQGILGHTDGPCYVPLVACISLESSAILTFSERLAPSEIGDRPSRVLAKVLLRPRSLVVFQGNAFSHALHEVAPVSEDIVDSSVVNLEAANAQVGEKIERRTRVSVTLRTWAAALEQPGPRNNTCLTNTACA
mmetsp:Transcript_15066/g.27758  ORF Transcript_15066/g.27758 Transcript_15066/m.27758 type:complete len:295 (-) Transcript_15066:188-1072(-)